MESFTRNPLLETFAPEGWMGNPLDKNGRFLNLNHPFWPQFSKLWQWQTTKNPQKKEKKQDLWLPDLIEETDFLARKDDCLVWLGHSSFFIRLAGVGILIDPVFGNATVVKRKIPFPYKDQIAQAADVLLISHDHRDHCDLPSLKQIARSNPGLNILSGLKMAPLLSSIFEKGQIEEAGWYQKFSYNHGGLEFFFLPTRHWSRRSLADTNVRLWGSFYVSSPTFNVYFMGDSGFDTHFEQIGQHFPRANFALMGIGAYSPEWFMHSSHMKPEDSWKAFQLLNAEMFIPMHYGTFDLADEPLSEPLRRIRMAADNGKILSPAVGQTIWL